MGAQIEMKSMKYHVFGQWNKLEVIVVLHGILLKESLRKVQA